MTFFRSIFTLLVLSSTAHAADGGSLPDRLDSKQAAGEQALSGSELAAKHCTHCHGIPDPNQLPKEAWPQLFDLMSAVVSAWPAEGTHAAKVLTRPDPWDEASGKTMLEYFVKHAPSEEEIRSSIQKPAAITIPDADFQPTLFGLPSGRFLTMLHYDAGNRMMLLGLGQTRVNQGQTKVFNYNAFVMLTQSREMISFTKHPSPPIHVDLLDNALRLTLIGDMAEDIGEGEVVEFSWNQGKIAQTSLLRDLPRPVGSRTIDFDADGVDDLLVGGFGGNMGTGESAIYWGGAASPAEAKQIIFPASGSLDPEVADFNGDGKPDILLLIAQRTQALHLYLNLGERRFEQRTLIQRPIGWGYMDLEVVDIDTDGDLDIITVAGNNMELKPPPLKAYHGIRIWINDTEKMTAGVRGHPSLREAYFYPLYGAGQVLVLDADGDGALDLAATAFAPDWTQQWPETFVLLKQTARLEFQPYHVSPAHWRRWTFLSKGDDWRSGGSTLLLGDTWLPFGASDQMPARLKKILESPSQIYSLQLHLGMKQRNE